MWATLLCFTFFVKQAMTQTRPQNCLQRNPEILDAVLWPSRSENITQEFYQKQISLFRSRFNQGHLIMFPSMEWLNEAAIAVKKFTESTGKDAKIFATIDFEEVESPYIPTGSLKIRERLLVLNYRITLQAIEKINSGNIKPIVGLYLSSDSVNSYEVKLRAVKKVFGSQNHSKISVGEVLNDCFIMLDSKIAHQYLRRLNFITCHWSISTHEGIEAGTFLGTHALSLCDLISKKAIQHNITAKIYCAYEYNSETLSIPKMSPRYYANFKNFWCGIVEKLLQNNETGFKIIMIKPFPYYLVNYTMESGVPYSSSWWKFTENDNDSLYRDAFVEKIQNVMTSGNHFVNDSNECDSCEYGKSFQHIYCRTMPENISSSNQNSPPQNCFPYEEKYCKEHLNVFTMCSWTNETKNNRYYVKRVPEYNCLRMNPNSLDAIVSIHNPEQANDQPIKITASDYVNLLDLVYTRFETIHEFRYELEQDVSDDLMRQNLTRKCNRILLGTYTYDIDQHEHSDNFLRWEKTRESYMRGLIRAVALNFTKTFKVVGLYLNSYLLPSYKLKLDAANEAFGFKKYSAFKIGEYFPFGCFKERQYPEMLAYLHRLDFLACSIPITYQGSPENAADDAISRCDKVQNLAKMYGIQAKITCVVSFKNKIFTPVTNKSSLDQEFQRFWCRILSKVVHNTHPKVIMSAFDSIEFNKLTDATSLTTGWWRKTHSLSFESGSFVERLEELEGTRRFKNCSKMCEECTSFIKCCIGCCVPANTSLTGQETKPRFICKSEIAICDPFVPVLEEYYNVTKNSTNSTEWSQLIFIIGIGSLLIGSGTVMAVAYLVIHKICTKTVFTAVEMNEFFRGGSDPKIKTRNKKLGSFGCELAYEFPYNKQLEIKKRFFKIHPDKVLGQGAFGIVLEGTVHKKPVAVKTLIPIADKDCLKSLVSEFKLLSYIGYHENIVNLVGASSSDLRMGKFYIFLELCPFGNLMHYLRTHRADFTDPPDNDFMVFKDVTVSEEFITEEKHRTTLKDLIVWSIQIANAMVHLAQKNVIHGDIAARNILVFSPMTVKLTDFGLSRRLHNYTNYIMNTSEPLPWRHMAPEALRDLNISLRSDVWSFGVTLWEIFSLGQVPFQGFSYSDDFIKRLEEGYRPAQTQFASELMFEVMTLCWTSNLMFRPEMYQIKSKLDSIFENSDSCDGSTSAGQTSSIY